MIVIAGRIMTLPAHNRA